MAKWGSEVEIEIRRRIKVCIYAYAYELEDDSLVSDDEFDIECQLVDVLVSTGNKKLDNWFLKEFDWCTGSWIHSHPELNKIKNIYDKYYKL